jgi:hypothetical protein
MSVTLDVIQLPMGWSKAVAPLNLESERAT